MKKDEYDDPAIFEWQERTVTAVLDLIEATYDKLEAMHHRTPASFFGRPTRKHHEIMGATRVLKELHGEFCRMLTERSKATGEQS